LKCNFFSIFSNFSLVLFSPTEKRTTEWTEWLLEKAGIKQDRLEAVKRRKVSYFGHNVRKASPCRKKYHMKECQVQPVKL